jgi:cytochrome c oxidase assembly protein Cox11
MLILTKGQINKIYVTASGNSEAESDEYRFVFVHDQQKKEIEVTLTDESDHTGRYNLFTIQEGVTATLPKTGQYKYTVYDADDVVVETGKALVITAAQATSYIHSIESSENFIHS